MRRNKSGSFSSVGEPGARARVGSSGFTKREGGGCSTAGSNPFIHLQRARVHPWQCRKYFAFARFTMMDVDVFQY